MAGFRATRRQSANLGGTARRALSAARAEIAQLRAMVDAIPELLYLKDRAGRVLRVNPAVLRATGHAEEALIGRTSAALQRDPSSGAVILANDLRIMERGVPEVVEERVVTPRGPRIFVSHKAPVRDARGVVVGLVGISTDVTEQRRAGAELRESEERFRALAESMPLLVFVLDPAGEALFYNERWREYTGLEAPDGASRLALVHPEDRPGMMKRWAAARASVSVVEIDFRMRGRDGKYRWFLLRARPVRDAEGAIARWIGTATDVDEMRRVEQALSRSEARARASAEELYTEARRKDAFLAMLSHELRNPLAPARASLYVLTRAPRGSDQARQAEAVIARQLDHMTHVVEDLLDLTRISRGVIFLQPRPLDLADLVCRVAEDHAALFAAAGVTLVVAPGTVPVPLLGDPTRLGQVLGNLLHNAAKFTPRGGRVGVCLRVDEAAGHAVISVRDTGVGIDAEILPRIFNAFTQAESTLSRSRGGLGLGLALVKGLSELHGGTVEARSEGPGKGAEMIVRLPLGQVLEVPERVSSTLPARARRVLVVDDMGEAAESLRAALEIDGHTVVTAESGPEALAAAGSFHPEIVLCDIGLPGMDGYAVARAFRADPALSSIFLVALTGYAQPSDIKAAMDAGFDRHIAKPATIERLAEVLAEAPA
jgi:PAS domain S-box-containing protein